MRILMTGGLGYVGSYLVKYLHRQKEVDKVILYDNLHRRNFGLLTGEKIDGDKVEFVRGDILDGRKLQQLVDRSDTVLHLAAMVTTPFADSGAQFFDQVNHWGTAQLVSALEKSEVKHVVSLSSASVYGNTDAAVNENSIPQPDTFYGISKRDAEEEILRLKSKKNYHILRCGNVYGYSPALRIDGVINRFMMEANYNRRITVLGDGHQVRPFIHIHKLMQILTEVLLHPEKIEKGIYNLFEHNLSINELIGVIRELYPDLETIHTNKDYPVRSLELEEPCKLMQSLQIEKGNLKQELEDFRSRFSF